MKTIKYFTKKILIEYNNAAIREKRNRALKEHFLEKLQDDWIYPIAKWNEKMQKLEIEDEEEIRKRFPYKNREWTEKVEKKPYRKQGKFRKEVLSAYGATCAVCGLHEPSILRAAHIVPVAKGGVDDITNGICLCTNHELAFDKGLIKIRPDGKVEVKSSELKGIYDKILFPKDKQNWPDKDYLREKYNMK